MVFTVLENQAVTHIQYINDVTVIRTNSVVNWIRLFGPQYRTMAQIY
jgi:hypothetical protein